MASDAANASLGVVLVVGGRGFVGSHCIQDLLHNGASKVHTLNSKAPDEDGRIPGVDYHTVDLGDTNGILRVVQLVKPKVVIHTASPPPFVEWPSVYDRVNIQGIRNMLSACDEAGVTKAFVYCSSASVIDSGGDIRGGDETWPVLYAPQQKEPYWHSKAVGEKLVLEHNRKNAQQMLTTALRVTSVFGENDPQIIGAMIARAKKGQLKTQIGNGKNRNDWTYVGNVAAAHTLAAKRLLQAVDMPDPAERRVEGEAFFVTNDEPRPFWGFARQVAAEAGFPVKPEEIKELPAYMAFVIGYISEWYVYITSLGQRKASISRRSMRFGVVDQIFSNEKAKRQLGYRPAISIDEGIKLAVAWALENDRLELDKTK